MQDFFATLAIVVTLAAVAEAITEFFVARLWDRYGLDSFWLAYVGAAVTGALVVVSGQNLLADYLPNTPALVWLGRILTAILAGRGSNWLHDFWSARRKEVELHKAGLSALADGRLVIEEDAS